MKQTTRLACALVSFVGLVPLVTEGCSDTAASGDAGPATSASAQPTGAAPPQPSASTSAPPQPTDGGADASPSCDVALDAALKPIDTVSTGAVTVLEESGGARLLFVDATAGGPAAASTNPRVYLDLGTGRRVEVSDKAARTSSGWDLALERAVIFTNSGHGGPGVGSAVYVAKPFADVTAADAGGKTFPTERFVDERCAPILDPGGALKTSFDGWYDYDAATNKVTPKTGTFLVKGAKGALYGVAVTQYYATSDGGGPGAAGANYTLRVNPL